MTPASRHQHDTLDQIREHLEEIDRAMVAWYAATPGPSHMPIIAHAREALALLVGVGCGNAKKDTPA